MVNPPLHRAVLEHVPHLGRMHRIREIDRQFESLLRIALDARGSEIDVRDTSLCAFLTVQSVKGVTLSAVFERPGYLRDDQLADELACMFVRYAGKRSPRRR